MRRGTSRWPLGATGMKVLGPDALGAIPKHCTAERALPPPAHPQHCFLVLFLVFSGFCCYGAQCLLCTRPVWPSLHWPSQTMSCSPSSLTVSPPIMPPGSSPWCVYVSICFSRTHKACLGFTWDHSRGCSGQARVTATTQKASGEVPGQAPWPVRDIQSLPTCLQQAQWAGAGHNGAQIPAGLRGSGGRWACGMGQCCAPHRAMGTQLGWPTSTGHPPVRVTHWHGLPTTSWALPSLLWHSQLRSCRKHSTPPALH